MVVAIIALLAAMLLPALGRARHSAHIVGCLSQLRQHGLALAGYSSDHDNFYPEQHPHPFANNPYSFRLSYFEVLAQEYGLDVAVWNDVNWAGKGFATGAYYDRVPPRYVAGYLVLAGGSGYPTWRALPDRSEPYNGRMLTVAGKPMQQSGSPAPDRVPLVGDYLQDGYYGTWVPHGVAGFFSAAGPSSGAPPSPSVTAVLHKANHVFEDGHAASRRAGGSDGIRQYDATWGYYFWW